MVLLRQYYQSIVKHDLTNKFIYRNIKKLPKIKKLTLNLSSNSKDFNLKNLAIAALSLELVTKQKVKLTLLKNLKISVKIRKGHPVGCKVTLRKNIMYDFFFKLLTDILPKIKHFYGIDFKKNNKNALSFKLVNTSSFNEFEKSYDIFKNTPILDITFVTDTKSKKELLYLLNSCCKIPFVF